MDKITDTIEFQRAFDRKISYLNTPLYSELIPGLCDDYYRSFLKEDQMIGACIAEVRRIKGELKRLKTCKEIVEKSKQFELWGIRP